MKIEESVYRPYINTNKGNKLGLWDRKVLVKTLGEIYVLPLGTYYGSDLLSSECSIYEIADGMFEGLLLWVLL